MQGTSPGRVVRRLARKTATRHGTGPTLIAMDDMPPPPVDGISGAEAADILGIGELSVSRLVHSGVLPKAVRGQRQLNSCGALECAEGIWLCCPIKVTQRTRISVHPVLGLLMIR